MKIRFAFSLSRLYRHFGESPFAIISAYLSGDPDNEERAAEMKRAVRSLGLGYREIKGAWVEQEGPHEGKTLVEYPLFIPGIEYQDALWLAQAGYLDRKPQYSFIYSDGNDVVEYVTTTENPRQEFTDFEANDLERVWEFYSEYRGRKFRFGATTTVEYDMMTPPPQHPRGYAEHRAFYSDRAQPAHDYRYRRPTDLWVAVQSRLRRLEVHTADTVQYRVVRPHRVDHVTTSLARRPFSLPWPTPAGRRTARTVKWNPNRFVHRYSLPRLTQDQWELHPRNLLLSRGAYDAIPLERISWHPLSGQMLLSGKGESFHAHDIHNQGSHPFDEYIRALVLPGKRRVVVRPWWPFSPDEAMRLDAGEAELVSFEAQDALRKVLAAAGMPKSWSFEYDGDNARLEKLTGRRDW
ncbi:hypothetical protein LCGC14_0468920 [marine sediment metagenome]|uniref:Uncharacterized protein n=1 Tax=marine sediment metagenome TaxID=412755 RepID=A0A0F9UZK4_9ZZZZ